MKQRIQNALAEIESIAETIEVLQVTGELVTAAQMSEAEADAALPHINDAISALYGAAYSLESD